jgi:hypothetical protein
MRALPRADAPTSGGPASLRRAFVVGLAAVLCAFVGWQLVVPGPLGWAVSQPAAWQGGLEAAALLAGLALAQCLATPRARLLASLLIAAPYLRRHAVDAPLVLCVLYLEFTLALGAAVARAAGAERPRHSEDYLRCFLLGLSAWSVLAWTSAAAGWGTPSALRLLTVLLLPVALWSRSRPLGLHLAQRSRAWPLRDRVLLALLGGWLLVLFARTNTAFSFDGIWYGLRPEYVLSADGSPFAPLGLVSPVYYFPKLYEVYLLPFAGLGDASVVSGMTILLLGLVALAGARLLARLGVDAITARLSLALLVFTLPAIANPAIEPKPDIACALFLLLACLFGGDALQRRDRSALAWALAAALLSLSSKLIAVPYLGMLSVGAALAYWRMRSTATATPAAQDRLAYVAFALALGAAAFVMLRTWLLAGMPTIGPDPLFKIWTWLGFSLREPAGTLTWAFPQRWSELPGLVVDWLLRPQRMEHIVISWTGNVWLWLPFAALLLRAHPLRAEPTARGHRALALSLVAAGLIIATGWSHHARGSDGNYFIAALVPALALGVAFARRRLHHQPDARRSLLAGIALFAAFQGAYAFVSASWAPGTRAFDLTFDRSPRDARKLAAGILEHAGLADVGDYLRARPGVARVVGCAPFEAAMRLPARFEDFTTIAQSRPEYVKSLDTAVAYMRRFAIRYVLLPKPRAGSDPATQLIDGCTPQTSAPAGTRIVFENARFLLAELVDTDSS